MHKVKNLKIWSNVMNLVKQVYLMVGLPLIVEKFRMTSQIKRFAVSIQSNNAEEAGRNSNKEFKHYLSILNDSCYELQAQLTFLIELNLISKEKVEPIIQSCIEIQKMNYSFQKSLLKVELNTQY